jgi:uncharacterized membrane protein YkvA (DUF1232 family)
MRQQNSAHRADWNEQLHTIERVRLTMRLLRDPRVAVWMKAMLPIVAALYVLLPIDLIPDVILGFGQIDDLSMIGVLLFAMTKLLPKLAPDGIVHEHLSELRDNRIFRRRRRDEVVDADFIVVDRPPSDYGKQSSQTRWENRA